MVYSLRIYVFALVCLVVNNFLFLTFISVVFFLNFKMDVTSESSLVKTLYKRLSLTRYS